VGSEQLSLELAGSGVTRWRIDGVGRFSVRSCDGNEEPAAVISGRDDAGGLWAPLADGKYFIDAVVEAGGTPALAVEANALPDLSTFDCASAPVVPDDLAPYGGMSLFYPSSVGPRFTTLAGGKDRTQQVLVSSYDPAAAAGVCTSCDPQSCQAADADHAPTASTTPPGLIVSVPAGPALTVSIHWF